MVKNAFSFFKHQVHVLFFISKKPTSFLVKILVSVSGSATNKKSELCRCLKIKTYAIFSGYWQGGTTAGP